MHFHDRWWRRWWQFAKLLLIARWPALIIDKCLLPKLFLISQKENQLACLASKPPADFYLLDSHCKTINSQLMIEAYWNLWAFDELHRTISRGVICCCKTFQTKKRNLIRNYDSQVLGNLAIIAHCDKNIFFVQKFQNDANMNKSY